MKIQTDARNHFERSGFCWKKNESIVSFNPKLLFNISGGVAYEDVIDGKSIACDARIASIQTCLRTDGWEKIGVSGRHHLAFDMLGHFSFFEGDEWTVKNLMIESAWRFLTDCVGIRSRDLFTSVHPRDVVSQKIWNTLHVKTILNDKNVTFTPSRNHCGLRTEIIWRHPETMKIMELWNLVFTQFQGDILFDSPLGKIAADSGASVDRIITANECCDNNYENSLWKQVVQSLLDCSDECNYEKVCRLADLGKSASLLIFQGLIPGNKAAEYVLRRIIRESYIICRQIPVSFEDFEIISINRWVSVVPMRNIVFSVIKEEMLKFEKSFIRGRKEYAKLKSQKADILNEQDIKYLASTFGYTAALIELDNQLAKRGL